MRIRNFASLTLGALGGLNACSQPAWPTGTMPGQSDVQTARPTSRRIRSQASTSNSGQLTLASQIKDWTLVRAKFASQGHPIRGTWSEVRAAPDVSEQYLANLLDAPYPKGAGLALVTRDGNDVMVAIALMERRTDGWAFRFAQPPDAPPPALHLCAACHNQAPRDGTFGLPQTEVGEAGTPQR